MDRGPDKNCELAALCMPLACPIRILSIICPYWSSFSFTSPMLRPTRSADCARRVSVIFVSREHGPDHPGHLVCKAIATSMRGFLAIMRDSHDPGLPPARPFQCTMAIPPRLAGAGCHAVPFSKCGRASVSLRWNADGERARARPRSRAPGGKRAYRARTW